MASEEQLDEKLFTIKGAGPYEENPGFETRAVEAIHRSWKLISVISKESSLLFVLGFLVLLSPWFHDFIATVIEKNDGEFFKDLIFGFVVTGEAVFLPVWESDVEAEAQNVKVPCVLVEPAHPSLSNRV